MRVLGIDPGLRYTGFGCIEVRGTEMHLVHCGVLRVPQKERMPHRLRFIHDGLDEVIRETSPTLVAIEQVFVHRDRAQTAMQMGHARGVMLLAAGQHDIEVQELAPAEIKRAVAGHGRADKSQIQHAVAALLNLDEVPDQPDLADALAAAIAAAARRL